MDYNYKLVKMCERTLYPDRPEYLNSFSALYMCFISAYYLSRQTSEKFDQTNFLKNELLKKVQSKQLLTSNSISIIYWCIFVNGIGSFLYHWYAWYIFKLLDEFSMIIPIWIGLCKIMHNLNYSIYCSGILTFINIFLLVLNVFPWFQDYFPIAFASEIIILIPLYYQSLKYLKDEDSIGLKGILICCSSGILWGVIEANCNKYLIFGHSIWHIGMSTGLCYIIQYFKNLEHVSNILKTN
jgi:hypothetical protein